MIEVEWSPIASSAYAASRYPCRLLVTICMICAAAEQWDRRPCMSRTAAKNESVAGRLEAKGGRSDRAGMPKDQ